MAQCILALCSQRDSVELSIDLVARGQFEAPPWVKKVRTLGERRRENASVYQQLECQLKEERRCMHRDCERSEAIQNPSAGRLWIASLRSQ